MDSAEAGGRQRQSVLSSWALPPWEQPAPASSRIPICEVSGPLGRQVPVIKPESIIGGIFNGQTGKLRPRAEKETLDGHSDSIRAQNSFAVKRLFKSQISTKQDTEQYLLISVGRIPYI